MHRSIWIRPGITENSIQMVSAPSEIRWTLFQYDQMQQYLLGLIHPGFPNGPYICPNDQRTLIQLLQPRVRLMPRRQQNQYTFVSWKLNKKDGEEKKIKQTCSVVLRDFIFQYNCSFSGQIFTGR